MAWIQTYFWLCHANWLFGVFSLNNYRYRCGKLRYNFSSRLGIILLWGALAILNIKMIVRPVNSNQMKILRYLMLSKGTCKTLKSTPSIMDDPSAQVLEYRSYWFSNSVVLTLKNIPGWNIFLSGGNEDHLNGSLKVVSFYLFCKFQDMNCTIMI